MDAASGKELWSTGTQTGVIAAPATYEIDGEQYVAIMAGTGSSWALIGGDTNMKGFEQRNLSRLLVYKVGGSVQLPPVPEKVVLPMNPPPATAAANVVGKGGDLYGAYCANCHGPVAIQLGILPDLRRSVMLQSAESWQSVVIGGARQQNGMASFASVMTGDDAEAIRAFVIMRAHQDAPAANAAATAAK